MTLTPERWQQVREVLHQTLQMDEQERSAFLDSRCATDPSLLAELNELLAAEGEVGSSFLEEPAIAHAAHTESSATETVLQPGTKLGPYVVQSLVGAGGMGEVYRARDAELKRDVAIKVLPASLSRDPDRLRRFQLEAQSAAALNHPNILSIFAIGQQDGSPYIVTELLEGETVRERLRHGAVKLRDAIDIAIQTTKGLAAAHEKGIAHRDLKPENLFLVKDGRVKILDFGLAKLMQASSGSDGPTISLHDQTDVGRVLGTVGYMSPEQVRGRPADARSDIFALGCVLYEMLTGKRAFRKPTSAETMSAILNEDPPAASEITRSIPPALQRVVHRCLEKPPERRFQSASDLAFALEALSDSGVSPLGAGQAPGKSTVSRRGIARRVAISMALLAVAWLTYLWLRPEPVPKVSNYVQLTHDGKPKGLVGTDGSRLYLKGVSQVSVTGGEPVEIPTPSPQMMAVDVSPDGSRLLLVQFKDNFGKGSLLWSVPILGGSPRRLGESVGQSAAWSPDGSMLAFGNEKDLFVAKADGTEPRKVTTMRDLIQDVTWSPKESEVQFVTGQAEIPQTWLLWQVSLDGKNLHQVLPGWSNSEGVCCGRWTTNGRYLVFPSNGQIWALPKESGFLHFRRPKPVQLTSSPMVLDTPIPSRDGKKLFVVGRTSQGELTRYNVKTERFESFVGAFQRNLLTTPGMASRWSMYPTRKVLSGAPKSTAANACN
jgi:serine/threonine protein kinase